MILKGFKYALLFIALCGALTGKAILCEPMLANVSVNHNSCGNVTLSYEMVQGTTPISVKWLIDNKTISYKQSLQTRLTEKRTYKYTLVLTNNCETVSLSGDIENEFQANTVTASSIIKECSEVTFDFDFTDQTNLPENVEWKGDDLFSSSEFFPKHVYSRPGDYAYNLTIISHNFCDTSVYQGSISIVNPFVADAGADRTVCIDKDPLKLVGQPEGGIWMGAGIRGNKFDPSIAGAGIHNLTYRYQLNGCLATDEMQIDVHQVQAAFETNIIKGLAPLEVDFTNKTSGNYTELTWNFGDPESGSLNNSTNANAIHTYTKEGSYTVQLEALDPSSGCASEMSQPDAITVFVEKTKTKVFNNKISVIPNPYSGIATVEVDLVGDENYEVAVLDMMGNPILRRIKVSERVFNIETPNISSGCYIIRITLNTGLTYTNKVINVR
jgi:PKD repeat protein